MTYRLRFLEEAFKDIEEASLWYAARSSDAHTTFLREIDQAMETILDAPHRWPNDIENTRRYVCKTFPYSVVYLLEDDIVLVVAVVHARRRPGYWRERLH